MNQNCMRIYKKIGDTYLEDISSMIMTLMKIKLNFDIWKRLCFNLISFYMWTHMRRQNNRGTAANCIAAARDISYCVVMDLLLPITTIFIWNINKFIYFIQNVFVNLIFSVFYTFPQDIYIQLLCVYSYCVCVNTRKGPRQTWQRHKCSLLLLNSRRCNNWLPFLQYTYVLLRSKQFNLVVVDCVNH